MKRLKNDTIATITVNGTEIDPAAYYTIEQHEELAWRDDSTIEALIDSADLIFNIGGVDITDTTLAKKLLNAVPAETVYFKNDTDYSNGFTANEVQSAIEEARLSGIGTVHDYHFSSSTSNTNNAWLSHADPSATSNEVPMIAPQDMDVKGVTFSNKDDNSETDVEIYKNGTLEATVEIRDARYGWELGTTLLSVSQGDRLSVYLKKVDQVSDAPTKPLVTIFCKFTNEQADTDTVATGD